MSRALKPPDGWEDFPHTEPLEATVWAALPLVEQGGVWRYYNLTSTSCIWDSDMPDRNWLSLSLRRRAGRTSVDELVVELTPSAHPSHAQLEALVRRLDAEFGVR
jgi:hypothetical protein